MLRKTFHLIYRHIQTFGQSCSCLQCWTFWCVFVGGISFEYPHDDMPSTGMIVFHFECILCITFALMFVSLYYAHNWRSGYVWKLHHYACLSICPTIELKVKVLLESLPEHRPSLHVYLQLSPVPNYTALLQTQWTAWRFLYTAAPWPRVDSMSTWTQVWRPTCYTTTLRHLSVSVVKISDKFIRPTTVFCGTDLLYQTQYEIQITTGSGSMNESHIHLLCLTRISRGSVVKMVDVFCYNWCKLLQHLISMWYLIVDQTKSNKIWSGRCSYLIIL